MSFYSVWQNPNLRRLIAARFISNLGNGLAPIAIPFGVFSIKGATATSLSLVWVATFLPLVVFTLFGGVIGDRYPRAKLVGGADVLLGLLVITNGFALITHNGRIWLFLFVGFTGGILNAIWYPSMAALTTDLADEKILQESNSSIMLSSNVAMIIGSSIGGVLVAAIGPGWAIFIDGCSFLLAGGLVYSLNVSAMPNKTRESNWNELRSGWQEFISHKWIVAIVAASPIIFGVERAVYSVIGPVVANEKLGGPKPWSVILVFWGFGSIVGVLIAGKFKPKFPIRFALGSQFPILFWIFGLSFLKSIVILSILALLVGVAMDMFYVFWVTTIQQHVAKDSLSKVLAYDAWGAMSLSPIILGVAGPLTQHIGTQRTLVISGSIYLLALILPLLVKEVRSIQAISN